MYQDQDESTPLGATRRILSPGRVFRMLLGFLGGGDGSSDVRPGDNESPDERKERLIGEARDTLQKAREGKSIIWDVDADPDPNIPILHRVAAVLGSDDPRDGVERVRALLSEAGADSSALDPSGKRTAGEMDAELRNISQSGYVASARKSFQELTSPGSDPSEVAGNIERSLAEANKLSLENGGKPLDFSILDPTGSKSSAELEQELHKKIVEGYIINARRQLFLLEHSANAAYGDDGKTQEWLDKANRAAREYGFKPVDASALDPEGRKSGAEINRDILKAIEYEHVQNANLSLYFIQHGGYGDPEAGARDLRGELDAANKAARALGEGPIDAASLTPTNVITPAGTVDDANAAALRNRSAVSDLVVPLDTPTTGASNFRGK